MFNVIDQALAEVVRSGHALHFLRLGGVGELSHPDQRSTVHDQPVSTVQYETHLCHHGNGGKMANRAVDKYCLSNMNKGQGTIAADNQLKTDR